MGKYQNPSQKSGMFLYVFLYVICQMYVFCMFVEMAGSNVSYVLYMFYVCLMLYVCFIMIGLRSLNYDWFPLIVSLCLNQRYEYTVQYVEYDMIRAYVYE